MPRTLLDTCAAIEKALSVPLPAALKLPAVGQHLPDLVAGIRELDARVSRLEAGFPSTMLSQNATLEPPL